MESKFFKKHVKVSIIVAGLLKTVKVLNSRVISEVH